MEKTMLWEAFATLDKSELRELAKFVRSPFFNQKQALVALFDYLRDCLEGEASPDSEAAFARIFPAEKKYDDQKMRLANSDLLALLELFWSFRETFRDPARAKIGLAATYRKRNLGKHFGITLRELRAARDRQPFRHAEYFHDLNSIEWEQYQFASAAKRTEAFNLQEMSNLMDNAFIANKLRHVCFSLSHQAVFKTDYDFGLLDAVAAHVEAKVLAEIPAIGLYFHCFRFLTAPDAAPEFSGGSNAADSHFLKFKAMLFANAAAFPEEELRMLYLLAVNFGIKKINESPLASSQRDWSRQTLDLYQNALQLNLLLENGFLSRFAFNNIAAIALHVGEVAWAEQFIHHYRPFLERKHRDATFSLNLARVAYARKDFATALQNLQRADYKDLINNLNAKILQLKIYYETGEFDLLESHLASMKIFIRRQTSIGYHRTNYLNIAKFAGLLLALNRADRAACEALRRRIEEEPVLTERHWFLTQIT